MIRGAFSSAEDNPSSFSGDVVGMPETNDVAELIWRFRARSEVVEGARTLVGLICSPNPSPLLGDVDSRWAADMMTW